MSPYGNYRVVIASLFLPQTGVFSKSRSQSSHPLSSRLPLLSLFNLISERPPYGRNKEPAPLKGIVEDICDNVN